MRAGAAASGAAPGSFPLWGEKKNQCELILFPVSTLGTSQRQTGSPGPLLGSPNPPVLMEKVPSEILLSQNFNGLAKRPRLPSGGAIISHQQAGCWEDGTVETRVALAPLALQKKPVFPLSRRQINADWRRAVNSA